MKLRNRIVGGLVGVLALIGCDNKKVDIKHNNKVSPIECSDGPLVQYKMPEGCREFTNFGVYDSNFFVAICNTDPVCKIAKDGPSDNNQVIYSGNCFGQVGGYISPKKFSIGCRSLY